MDNKAQLEHRKANNERVLRRMKNKHDSLGFGIDTGFFEYKKYDKDLSPVKNKPRAKLSLIKGETN